MTYKLKIEFGLAEVPDFEAVIEASSLDEAVDMFFIELKDEFSLKFIREHIIEIK
jgi:hypothetical protein